MFKRKITVPTYTEEDLQKYLSRKRLECVIFTGIKDINMDEDGIKFLHSQEFFDELINFVAHNSIKRFINPNIKKSIYDYLWYLRENKPTNSKTERETLIEDINEMISALNSSNSDGAFDFYRKEYIKRCALKEGKLSNFVLDEERLEPLIELIEISIAADYDIISGILIDDEITFREDVVSDCLIDHYTINTLNALFKEFPALYSNKEFLERAKFILINSKNLIEGVDCDYELSPDDEIDKELPIRTDKTLIKLNSIK